jgi:surface polysaccharide O-acyltransferase-like enzyme
LESERYYSIDFIKFFAIFSIVIIHTTPFRGIEVMGLNGDKINFVLDTLARFGVPFFFITSGYLFGLRLKQTQLNKYLKRYIFRLIKLYAYWQIFYFCYGVLEDLLFHTGTIGSINLFTMIYYGQNNVGYQLWYLVALIVDILLICIFYKANKINFLLFLSFIFNILGIFGRSMLNIETRDAIFLGLFYTTLGFFLSNYYKLIKSKVKLKSKHYLYLFIIFLFLQIPERWIIIKYLNADSQYYVSTIFSTICIFLFLLKNPRLGKNSVFTKIGEMSGGIFVIHIFVLDHIYFLFNLFHKEFIYQTIIWHVMLAPAVLIISYFTYVWIQFFKRMNIKNLS